MKEVFILGAGGHAKVLIDCLHAYSDIKILGILDVNHDIHGQTLLGEKILGTGDDILSSYNTEQIYLVNGLGSVTVSIDRQVVYEKFKAKGYRFLSVTHPGAYIAEDVKRGEGLQCMAGSVIQPGCCIGNNVIINTNASVDHDCIVEDHVHISPGVTCSGDVKIGVGSHIGTRAVIKQGIIVGERCLVAAGAVVVKNVPSNTRVGGVPAKRM